MVSTNRPARRTDKLARGMAASLAGMGALHFVAPKPFDSIVPPNLPFGLTPRRATQLSGVAELACAAGLAHPRTRRGAAWASAALLVAVFPANVQMAVDLVPRAARRPTGKRVAAAATAIARLPGQWPLIAWSLAEARQPHGAR